MIRVSAEWKLQLKAEEIYDMALTDNELCMIEQLCYLNSEVAKTAEVKSDFNGVQIEREKKTIGEILSCFDEEALERLRNKGNEVLKNAGYISAEEWAGIIEYIQQNEEVSSLRLSDVMTDSEETVIALCFEDKNDPSQALVAFKGTTGKREWVDNVKGMNQADTACQIEAKNYIEDLPYSKITVTGHSKGANKAMYVAITSDKVSRCVAYDGQGFSEKFIDKYSAEIGLRAANIKNYSLSTDYVHALMFPIPGSEQIYCKGYHVDGIEQHHSPNSFFMADEGGNIILDIFGAPIVTVTEEDASITMLHEFTTFVMNNADAEDKESIIGCVSELLATVFGEGDAPEQDISDALLKDPDALAVLIAYLAKYMDEYDLKAEDIDKLLLMLNPDNGKPGLGFIVECVKKQLNDGDDDWFIRTLLLPALKKFFFDDVNIDVGSFWAKIDSKVKSIQVTKGTEDYQGKTGTLHDFSKKVYQGIQDVINKVEQTGFSSVSGWNQYAHYEWFSSLAIPGAIRGITAYADNLTAVNYESKTRVEELFERISGIDSAYADQLNRQNDTLRTICTNLSNCAAGLS